MHLPAKISRRALFITAEDPGSTGTGGGIYTRATIRLLRASQVFDSVDITYTFRRSYRLPKRAERFLGLVQSLGSTYPEKSLASHSRGRLRAIMAAAWSGNYDAVILNHSELLWLLPKLPPSCAKILVSHNVEHKLWRARVANDGRLPRWLRHLLMRDAGKFERLELDGIRACGVVWAISSVDAAYYGEAAPETTILTVPPTLGTPPTLAAEAQPAGRAGPLRLGFVGPLSWWPNAEAIDWLLREVMPALLSHHVELHLFGHGTERYHGGAPNIDDVWNGMDVMACPIFSGSSVNVKLAEAVFRGKPTIATTLAARGLTLPHDPALVFLDDAAAWIDLLRAPAGAAQARRQAAPNLRTLFSDAAQIPRVPKFLREVLHKP